MKRYYALVLAFLCVAVLGVRAQGLDDQYVQIFNLIQEADGLSSSEPAQALAKYAEAQTALTRLKNGSPDWNPKMVAFRLSYIAAKIAALSTNAPAPAAVAATETNAPVTAPGAAPATNAPPAKAVIPEAVQAQIASLKEQVRQLQADRIVMEAKLKEALSVQPAEADPRELARAEERVKALQKENDLLKVTLQSEKSKPAVDTKALEAAQQSLAKANRQLDEQKAAVAKLTAERDALQNRVKTNPDLATLQAENQLLKQKLTAAIAPGQTNGTASKLAQAQTRIAALQSDKELLRIENMALESRLKSLPTNVVFSSVQPAVDNGSAARIRQLERERDNLQKKLDAAYKSMYGRKGKEVAARVQQLQFELSGARARLDILEARQVPYSPEELALLQTPEAKLAAAPPKKRRPVSELPPGSVRLVTEAQTWFASHQFDKAESAYQQVVQMDPQNVPALANLAVVQIEAGHLEAAEKNVRTALAEDPEDAFSLRTLGVLKFRKGKYDEALDALSRSARVEPDNAETQNYLGLVLAEKGMRVPAETALRKAVQLQPNYAGAHFNLALIYLSEKPPATELARWHYQKALAAGHAENPEIEKKLQGK